MAKVKYSALVSDMRNKLNGSVMYRGQYGAVLRNKVTPVNPQTEFQQEVRQLFRSLSSQWRNLTQAQRDGWIEAANKFPETDQFGDQIKLAGNALFLRLNYNLTKISESIILDAPTPQKLPTFSITNIMESGVNHTISIDISTINETNEYQIIPRATPSLSQSIKNVNSYLRDVPYIYPIDTNVRLGNGYRERMGFPRIGARISVSLQAISKVSGQAGVPITASVVVAP